MRNLVPPATDYEQLLIDLNLQPMPPLGAQQLKLLLTSARETYLKHVSPSTLIGLPEHKLPSGVTHHQIHSKVFNTDGKSDGWTAPLQQASLAIAASSVPLLRDIFRRYAGSRTGEEWVVVVMCDSRELSSGLLWL